MADSSSIQEQTTQSSLLTMKQESEFDSRFGPFQIRRLYVADRRMLEVFNFGYHSEQGLMCSNVVDV